jgi:hypothetical protein
MAATRARLIGVVLVCVFHPRKKLEFTLGRNLTQRREGSEVARQIVVRIILAGKNLPNWLNLSAA